MRTTTQYFTVYTAGIMRDENTTNSNPYHSYRAYALKQTGSPPTGTKSPRRIAQTVTTHIHHIAYHTTQCRTTRNLHPPVILFRG